MRTVLGDLRARHRTPPRSLRPESEGMVYTHHNHIAARPHAS